MSGWLLHPRHGWRGVHLDRTQLWPLLTLGWWTIEVIPPPAVKELIDVLAEIRKRRKD